MNYIVTIQVETAGQSPIDGQSLIDTFDQNNRINVIGLEASTPFSLPDNVSSSAKNRIYKKMFKRHISRLKRLYRELCFYGFISHL